MIEISKYSDSIQRALKFKRQSSPQWSKRNFLLFMKIFFYFLLNYCTLTNFIHKIIANDDKNNLEAVWNSSICSSIQLWWVSHFQFNAHIFEFVWIISTHLSKCFWPIKIVCSHLDLNIWLWKCFLSIKFMHNCAHS